MRNVASFPRSVAPHPLCPPPGERQAYQPWAAEEGDLQTIVRDHLETVLREAAECADGRMWLIVTTEDPRVIRRILPHLGLPTDVPQPRLPPRWRSLALSWPAAAGLLERGGEGLAAAGAVRPGVGPAAEGF